MNVKTKNIIEHVGGILFVNPELVYTNIVVLNEYGINLTNDDNNNGYTLLGMSNLKERLDYLIETKQWKKGETINLDIIDLLRGLIIKDGYIKYLDCKKNNNYGKIDIASSKNEDFIDGNYDEERIKKAFDDHNCIKNMINVLDNEYLSSDGIYSIDDVVISKQRILRNICNYRGNGTDTEIISSILKYKSSINNIDDIVNKILPLLEMGEKGVKLS